VAPAVSAPVEADPLNVFAPDQPPEAVQAVALEAVHVKVEDCPLVTVLGLELKETVAAAAGATVTVVDWAAWPPGPEQVSV
jgi:hypothetical protein